VPETYVNVTPALLPPESIAQPLPTYMSTWSTVPLSLPS
jgi:hypothetical protein